jgi:hypothetical protein
VSAARKYAELTGLRIHRDAFDPESLTVSYFPTSSGAVALWRTDKDHQADETADMLDTVRAEDVGSQRKVRWQIGDLKPGDVIRAEYRSGWSLVTEEKPVPEVVAAAESDDEQLVAQLGPGLYARRTRADRGQWIGKYGGSAASEQAVADGLDWLARHQGRDGSWSNRCLGLGAESRCEKDSPCADPGLRREMAHSGLALLAFQAGGHYYCNGQRYSDLVRKGLDWIVDHQQDDGALVGLQQPRGRRQYNNHYMYEHGIATFALGDACASAAGLQESPNPRYLQSLRKAVEFIERNQHHDGGWRYTDNLAAPSDTSVTGWQVLALKSAREAGVPPSEKCLANVRKYFLSRETGKDGCTGYESRNVQSEATTGVGMLAKQFLLDEPNAPLVRDAAGYLADLAGKRWPADVPPGRDRDYYLWYNCTLAMFQAGGEPWKKWNDCVRDEIIKLQRPASAGCERGSWDPADRWGASGGRIYSTALAALTLEVYYRYALDKENQGDAFDLTATARPGAGAVSPAATAKERSPGDGGLDTGAKAKKPGAKRKKLPRPRPSTPGESNRDGGDLPSDLFQRKKSGDADKPY